MNIVEIPENSRLAKYLNELHKVTQEDIIDFIKNIFNDCQDFILNSTLKKIPKVTVNFLTESKFLEEIKKLEHSARHIEPENIKTAIVFTIGSEMSKEIYINFGYRLKTLKEDNPQRFIMVLVDTFIHEICHIAFPKKSEQRIIKSTFRYMEEFLEVKLPEEMKRQKKALDSYEK